jgi:hypothetical protein
MSLQDAEQLVGAAPHLKLMRVDPAVDSVWVCNEW